MKNKALARSWRTARPATDGPVVLVVNDDGFNATGLWRLVQAVMPLGRVFVVAPDLQQSWTGRSLRSDRGPDEPVSVHEARPLLAGADSVQCWRVGGTPATCVTVAFEVLGIRPALVVSGINDDHNTGSVVTASGTLGAAWQASSYGVPAVAFSSSSLSDVDSLDAGLDHVHAVCRRVLSKGMPVDAAILSCNLPDRVHASTRWKVVRTSPTAPYHHHAVKVDDVHWRVIHHEDRNCGSAAAATEPETDTAALEGGYVSLTFWPRSVGLDVTW